VAGVLAHPGVVAGGDLLGAQAHGVVEKGLELDLGVAQHVGVGRAAGLVFAQELGEHAVLVVGGEVDVLDLDADHVGHGGGVHEVDVGRAVFAVVVVFPVLHEDADHLVALLLEQVGGDGGVHAAPTEAGLAFFREAQLALRHADQAARAAQQARLTGSVSVGLSPTTASVLGVPLMRAMHERYPDVRLHMVGSLSGHLSNMLNARQLDLAVLFDTQPARRWSVLPLLEERLFLIRSRTTRRAQTGAAAQGGAGAAGR
jgi:hypothetical protein